MDCGIGTKLVNFEVANSRSELVANLIITVVMSPCYLAD